MYTRNCKLDVETTRSWNRKGSSRVLENKSTISGGEALCRLGPRFEHLWCLLSPYFYVVISSWGPESILYLLTVSDLIYLCTHYL
jgi:MoaA/NifB/PqqE/SkfB family radical SAM enzyme